VRPHAQRDGGQVGARELRQRGQAVQQRREHEQVAHQRVELDDRREDEQPAAAATAVAAVPRS